MIVHFLAIGTPDNLMYSNNQFVTCANTPTNPYLYDQYASNVTAIYFSEIAVITFYGICNLDFF